MTTTLTHDQELDLARRWRYAGDRAAADMLARAHLDMVVAMAMRHRRYGVPVPELIAEGNCGIFNALRKFDPERKIRFNTYARHWVRAAIFAHILRSRSVVGGSSGLLQSRDFFKLRRERQRLANILGDAEAVDAALAERVGVPLERLQAQLVRLECHDVSLDLPIREDSSAKLIDTLEGQHDPETNVAQEQRAGVVSAAVHAALALLDPRERFIIQERTMAPQDDERTLAEIGQMLGISRERARQLEVRATHKLRVALASRRDPKLREWLAEQFPSAAA